MPYRASSRVLLVVRIAGGALVQLEELLEVGEGEVALHVLLTVHDAGAEGLLVRLPLEDLFLDRADLRK